MQSISLWSLSGFEFICSLGLRQTHTNPCGKAQQISLLLDVDKDRIRFNLA